MIEYFYTLTLLWHQDGRDQYGLYDGVAEVASGETQESIYRTLRTMACNFFGAPEDKCTVVNYCLARNEL